MSDRWRRAQHSVQHEVDVVGASVGVWRRKDWGWSGCIDPAGSQRVLLIAYVNQRPQGEYHSRNVVKSSESSSSMAIDVDFSATGARRSVGAAPDVASMTRMLFTDPNAFAMLCLSGSWAQASSTRNLYSNLPTGMLSSNENDPESALRNVNKLQVVK